MLSKKSGTRLDASENVRMVRLRHMLLLSEGFTTGAAERTKRQRATLGGSRAPSDTASLSSVLSSVLKEGGILDDGPRAANVDDEVWAEFKAELNARHLKTGLGVQGMLSKFVADKRSRPPPSRSAGPGTTDKHTNLLRHLSSSVPSLSLMTLEDAQWPAYAATPSAAPLAGRRASVEIESTDSHGRKVAEIGLRRSDRCPFDLGLADLDGQHATPNSVDSTGSRVGRTPELGLRYSCPVNISLLMGWGETDDDGLSREEEDGLSRFCNAEWKEDEAEEDVDVPPTDVFEALQEGDPPGGKGREEEVTAVDTEGETGLNGAATYLSLINDSVSFMQRKMKKSGTTQGREEAHNRGIESRVVPAVEGSDRGMIVTPGSDLFSRYLENKAKSRTGIAKPVTHGSNEDATPLALPATRSPGQGDGSSAKTVFQAGQLLVEWDDTTTATTEEEAEGEGKKTDEAKNEIYKLADINPMKPNSESRDQGERAVVRGGRTGLEHRCTTIDHHLAGCRMSDPTFVAAAAMAAELSASLGLRRRLRSLPIAEVPEEGGEKDGLLVAPHDGLH